MRFEEFGDRDRKKIILIHGLNIPWNMWEREIEILSEKYRVIVPVLDGHDIESEKEFISVEDEADKIRAFYKKSYGGTIYMVIGMSMGAGIAFDLLDDEGLRAENLVLDSGVFVPTNPVLLYLNNKMQISLKNKAAKRDPKTLEKAEKTFGKKLALHYVQMAAHMSDKNLLAASNSIGRFTLPAKINLEKTNIVAFHGTVFMEIQAKKSAKLLKRRFPKAYIKTFKGYAHTELSVNRPDEFIAEIKKAVDI